MTRVIGGESREDTFGKDSYTAPDKCVGCGKGTQYFCPFCYRYLSLTIHICENPECREKHEKPDGSGCIRTKKKEAV